MALRSYIQYSRLHCDMYHYKDNYDCDCALPLLTLTPYCLLTSPSGTLT